MRKRLTDRATSVFEDSEGASPSSGTVDDRLYRGDMVKRREPLFAAETAAFEPPIGIAASTGPDTSPRARKLSLGTRPNLAQRPPSLLNAVPGGDMERNRSVPEPEEERRAADEARAARARNGGHDAENKGRNEKQAPRGRTIPHLF